LLLAEPELQQALTKELASQWQDVEITNSDHFTLKATRESVQQIWVTSTQVNFSAKAYPTVSVDHPDAPALSVLGDFLRNGYLHRTIREQGGAYGSGAGQDSGDAVFRFFSYRDPRIEETLQDFDGSLEWLENTEHDEEKLSEAILGVVSSIDKPGSPAGEAKQAYHANLFGRTPAQRRAFRAKILAVSIADLQQVARTYLSPEKASTAIVTNAESAASLGDQYQRIAL
jgi:Zn-dependent M16 (insulinase) family peptidase